MEESGNEDKKEWDFYRIMEETYEQLTMDYQFNSMDKEMAWGIYLYF